MAAFLLLLVVVALVFALGVIILAGLLVFGGLVLAGARAASRLQPERSPLEGVPTTPIAGIQEGSLVKVSGRVLPQQARLAGPLSGQLCVAYAAEVSFLPMQHYRRPRWQQRWQAQEQGRFGLRDDSGAVALVDSGAALHLKTDEEDRAGGMKAASQRLTSLLSRTVGSRRGWGTGIVRACESRLEEGDVVEVQGRAHYQRVQQAPDAGAPVPDGHENEAQQLLLKADPQGGLIITDAAEP